MKTKIPLQAVLFCGLCSAASAFTLDFVGYDGQTLPPNPLTIPITGYGDVTFEAGTGSSLVVNSAFLNDNGFGAPALAFSQNDQVRITFQGAPVTDVDFDFVGVSNGETFVVQTDLFSSNTFLVNLQGGGDGAGIFQISFNAVPEPSASLLGALGASLLVIRRRR